MEIIELIILRLFEHFYTVSFLSGFFGEEAVLFLTFLASQSMERGEIIFMLAPLGILCIDIIYFTIGRFGWAKKSKKKSILNKQAENPSWVSKLAEKSTFLTLAITKFVFGTRVAFMIYLGAKKKVSYRKIILYELIAIYIWAIVMIPLAWLAGQGFTKGLDLVKDFSTIVGVAVLFVLAVYIIDKLLTKYIANRIKIKSKN